MAYLCLLRHVLLWRDWKEASSRKTDEKLRLTETYEMLVIYFAGIYDIPWRCYPSYWAHLKDIILDKSMNSAYR